MVSRPIRVPAALAVKATDLLKLLTETRNIGFITDSQSTVASSTDEGLLSQILGLQASLEAIGYVREAEVLNDVYNQYTCTQDDFTQSAEKTNEADILFMLQSQLLALGAAENAYKPHLLVSARSRAAGSMTLSEKILLHHSTTPLASVAPGDIITINVDWILASELSWHAMSSVYSELQQNRPAHDQKPASRIFRNDRFWLAGDHLVTSQNKSKSPYSNFVSSAEKARREFNMTEYQGMNYTIMHTEFVRSRALPAQIVVGSDSHTCSAGAVGSLAWGLGTSDVVMPLITGQTWIRVPESIRIDFIGQPPVGIGGKDVILHILGELGRNTVAKERIVEFGGVGAKYLSTDARFAICNMCTEFGAVTGLFIPDGSTMRYVQGRRRRRDREGGIYFKPDSDANYAQTFTIDLSKVASTVARYPKPDDVVPVGDMAGLILDGCFIGACTTAEEDLILAALALEAGLNKGLIPVRHGKRKVVPGSVPVRAKLDKLNLTEVYERAGFEIGEPSCSYCIGLSSDKAASGEVWLSSQNRNFENRMGPGAIGHITAAVVVAASSFNMTITDPRDLVAAIPAERLKSMGIATYATESTLEPQYMEPSSGDAENSTESPVPQPSILPSPQPTTTSANRRAPVQVLPSFVDTDALAPNESLAVCKTQDEFAQYCLKYTHPSFRDDAQKGANIVVAGEAFGCGSSREVAVTALQGCGIQAVIAFSFSFIFGRNAANLGLLCISLPQESGFYDAVSDGKDVEVEIDMNELLIKVQKAHETMTFPFKLSDMEKQLVEHGGMTNLWKLHGSELWNEMTGNGRRSQVGSTVPPMATVLDKDNIKSKELSW